MKFILKSVYYLIAIAIILVVSGGLGVYFTLKGSLPVLEGEFQEASLDSGFAVTRDIQGVVTITADSRADTAFALGFLHAQERFFQMDLLRRNSAGELSELFGSLAVKHDSAMRLYRFRAVAEQAQKRLGAEQKQLLAAYTQGVNRGLTELSVRPFEYLLLQKSPRAWREADTFLVLYSMYLDLQNAEGARERTLAVMQDELPLEWYEFLTPEGGIWDAPISGEAIDRPLVTPDSAWPIQLTTVAAIDASEPHLPGSNNWALAGGRTASGSGMLANDMHLGLRVPNIWYRASWSLGDRTITGATLPGTPAMIVGSNEHIAWGLTNSYGDWSDVVILDTNPSKSLYQTPEGWENFTTYNELVAVSGENSVNVNVRYTRWGPVIGENHKGQLLALKWVALQPDGANFNIMNLERADTTDQALSIAASGAIPHQNFVVADRDGAIGWTIFGQMPNRVGFDGTQPTSWADGVASWDGYRAAEDYPSVRQAGEGVIWTANSRTQSGNNAKKVGNEGYALGARAQQIRDQLRDTQLAHPDDMLAIQRDDRALFLERWHGLMVSVVKDYPNVKQQKELTKQLAQWQGRAVANSVGYRLVKQFRTEVIKGTLGVLYGDLEQRTAFFDTDSVNNLIEYPTWQLITEQPEHLVPLSHSSWDSFMAAAVNNAVINLTEDGQPLAAQTWGKFNTLNIVHPLSSAVPGLSQLLDYPQVPQSGDTFMPFVAGRTFGASERMVVSPGRESEGIFNMSTSQSGHPLSPYYHLGHDDWVSGKASPFLPQATQWSLQFSKSAE